MNAWQFQNTNLFDNKIEPFKYKEIGSIQLKRNCQQITLNPKQSILVISLCVGFQQFYQFKKGVHKLIGNFNDLDNIIWLYFFKQSQTYSSLNSMNKLKIWSVNCLNYNKVLCMFKFYQNISVMLFNSSEDLMIVGFFDGKLHLKRKQQLQWHTIQQIQIAQSCQKIILNQQENKILAQVDDMKIVIIEKNIKGEEQIWGVVQEIRIYNSFSNIIFISENTFAIKLLNIKKWILFKQKQNNQFNYKRDIQIYGSNNDLEYILTKYHKNRIMGNQDQSNYFLNLEFFLEQPYLALKDNKEFQNQSYFQRNQQDKQIIGEYFMGQDNKNKQIVIGKYQTLFIEYQVFRQITCYQNENYQAIALQIQLKILIVALNKQIKVFKLNDLAFTQQQVLNNHSRNVSILLFFQSVNSFISGSLDKSLIIWTWDEIGQIYQCNQIINNSVEQKFILINKQENLIISGGKNQISFWMSQSSKWLLQQKLGFDKIQIFGLNFSLNQQLIATYTSNHKIVLIKKQNNKTQNYWFISLQINVNDFTPSFCFISDFIILYQSIKDASLRLIKINQDSDQIEYQTKILINKVCDEQTTFPMQFNQQKQLVINQTGSFLNLILIIQGSQILYHKEIPFKSNNLLGQLSADGELLTTLDQCSNIIQLWKYHSN